MHKSTRICQLFEKKLKFNGSFNNGYSKFVQILNLSPSMVIIWCFAFNLSSSKFQYDYWHFLDFKFSSLTPSTQSNLFPNLIFFFYVETHKVTTSMRGGGSHFTTQVMSWTGSFRTFIVHGPCTGSKTVWIWLKIEKNTFWWQPQMEIPSSPQRTGLVTVRSCYC